ncbi:MAG: Asp-tRNA(Asn)/Glu-tRNA(Gln) amidotransferase GatCAB subunit A [SAR86 cluster bacterium]|uniref:Asp-tRNA(Asn)/Glu-tRNA(Gln) amidotransferase GatCAB subunit A n=1 Tax=SAR86 cluster bacterium TaxID=2030880 RepID=A0A2A4WYC5_9GAMM|nr:MAG: Asp-tRNA(Asn)/Glu-tRNA(Gln) amidotransferase GatCAB subunit A [SAR86 cluster bacterium]
MRDSLSDPIHYRSLSSVAESIRDGKISPVELTASLLSRIDSVDGQLMSYATVMAEQAMETAREAEQEILAGHYKGPLHGVPIAVKDLCFTAGTRTMGGLKVLREFVPSYDATVVRKLREAGSVILGKLNLTEGALSGYHRDFPIPVNPWGESLWAGVSSSGSGVATAAGLCFASLGTDTGGSIRYPAMANAVVGLKPTYGRVSRYGVLELAASLDHIGPMTRSVRDAAIVFETISGFDGSDSSSLRDSVPRISESLTDELTDIRIGVDEHYLSFGTNPALVDAIHEVIEVLRQLGAEIVALSMPKSDPMDLRNAWLPICAYEAHKAHSATYPSRADEYGGYFGDVLKMGASMSVEDYAKSTKLRKKISVTYESALEAVDAVICPSGGSVFPVEKEVQYGNMEKLRSVIQNFQGQFTIPADLAGTPTITVPCGFSDEGSPYAVQFLGNRLSESNLCRIAHAYEQATQWNQRHPTI